MDIYVDTVTGTWGFVRDLLVINGEWVDEAEQDRMADMSDSDRIAWAKFNYSRKVS